MIHDLEDLQKAIATISFLSIEEFQRLLTVKLNEIALSKGFSSINSKRCLSKLHNNVFVSALENGNYIASMFINRGKYAGASGMYLCKLKTKSGTLYVTPTTAPNIQRKYICFTAHLFDRYGQRNGKNGTRTENIRRFCKDFMIGGHLEDTMNIYKNGPRKSFFQNGLLLGESMDNIVLYKTYVHTNMMYSDQQNLESKEMQMLIADYIDGKPVPEHQITFIKNKMIEAEELFKDSIRLSL